MSFHIHDLYPEGRGFPSLTNKLYLARLLKHDSHCSNSATGRLLFFVRGGRDLHFYVSYTRCGISISFPISSCKQMKYQFHSSARSVHYSGSCDLHLVTGLSNSGFTVLSSLMVVRIFLWYLSFLIGLSTLTIPSNKKIKELDNTWRCFDPKLDYECKQSSTQSKTNQTDDNQTNTDEQKPSRN